MGRGVTCFESNPRYIHNDTPPEREAQYTLLSARVSLVRIHALQVGSLAGRDDLVCFFAVTDCVGVQVIGIDLSDALSAMHCCSVRMRERRRRVKETSSLSECVKETTAESKRAEGGLQCGLLSRIVVA